MLCKKAIRDRLERYSILTGPVDPHQAFAFCLPVENALAFGKLQDFINRLRHMSFLDERNRFQSKLLTDISGFHFFEIRILIEVQSIGRRRSQDRREGKSGNRGFQPGAFFVWFDVHTFQFSGDQDGGTRLQTNRFALPF